MNTKNIEQPGKGEPDPHVELAQHGDAGLVPALAPIGCKRHGWLGGAPQGGSKPCPYCADEAESARVLSGTMGAVAKFRVDGEVSTAVLLTTQHSTSCAGNEQLAIERHRDFFTAHLGSLRLEKVDKLPRTYTAEDLRKAFLAGSQWAIRAVAIESDTAPEAAADTYLASR